MAGTTVPVSLTIASNTLQQDSVNIKGITAAAGANYANIGNLPVLCNELNYVSVVAAAGDAVTLPSAQPGLTLKVYNIGAQELAVFAASSDAINGGAVGNYVTQQPSSDYLFDCTVAGQWQCPSVGSGFSQNLPTTSYLNAITAKAGGGQQTSGITVLTRAINRITTVATAGDSVTLPASSPGLQITIINAAAANSLNVFPSTGDAINLLATNAAYAQAAAKVNTFYCTVAGVWHSLQR